MSKNDNNTVDKRYMPNWADDLYKATINTCIEVLDDNLTNIRRWFDYEDRKVLRRVRRHLNSGVTGRPRPPLKANGRSCQFFHIILKLPDASCGKAIRLVDSVLDKYKVAIHELLVDCVGEGKWIIGYHVRVHRSRKDNRQSDGHFHVMFSRIRFAVQDREVLKQFELLSEEDRPYCALGMVENILDIDSQSLSLFLEPIWRTLIAKMSRMTVPDGYPALVEIKDKPNQNENDRVSLSKYINNNHLHIFKKLAVTPTESGDKVCLVYLDELRQPTGTEYHLPVRVFISNYLLLPNQRTKLRWYTRGFYHSKSKYAKIMDELSCLHLGKKRGFDPHAGKLIDAPVEMIKSYVDWARSGGWQNEDLRPRLGLSDPRDKKDKSIDAVPQIEDDDGMDGMSDMF